MKLKHRLDIVGLRGIAVLAVLFFHASPAHFPGGYAGVDVFLVLSGFLISATFLSTFDGTKASVLTFYRKRFNRIAPSAIFVFLLCWLMGLWILLPDELKDLSQSLFNGLLIDSHGWAKNSVDYFGISTQFKPLIHYWSLSIEILFYLTFPLLAILGLIAYRKIKSKRFFLGLYALLLAGTFYHTATHQNEGYFSFYARLWEFLLGTLIYFYGSKLQENLKTTTKNVLYITGLGLILVSIFALNSLSNFPGPAALIPTLGAGLILAIEGVPAQKLLQNSLLTFIGKISYSLYLIHQPVFAFFRIYRDRDLTATEDAICFALSIGLASIIWKFIETPFPKADSLRNKIVHHGAPVLALILLFLANQGRQEKLSAFNPSKQVQSILKYRSDNNPRKCRAETLINFQEACVYHRENKKVAVLWGDSHSDQIASPFADSLAEHGYSTLELAVAGCPPLLNAKTVNIPRECEKNADAIVNYLIANKNIKTIFMHAYWQGYFEDKLIAAADSASLSFEGDMIRIFKKTLNTLTASGKNLVIIRAVPRMPVNPPFALAREKKYAPNNQRLIVLSESQFQKDSQRTTAILNDICAEKSVTCFDISKYLYNKDLNAYVANTADVVFYRDDNHLSLTGAKLITPHLVKDIFDESKRKALNN
ncbi:MAG: acyltransferase family protein [Bdellovibrio sp.]